MFVIWGPLQSIVDSKSTSIAIWLTHLALFSLTSQPFFEFLWERKTPSWLPDETSILTPLWNLHPEHREEVLHFGAWRNHRSSEREGHKRPTQDPIWKSDIRIQVGIVGSIPVVWLKRMEIATHASSWVLYLMKWQSLQLFWAVSGNFWLPITTTWFPSNTSHYKKRNRGTVNKTETSE